MGGELDQRQGSDGQRDPQGASSSSFAPGKRTLTEQLLGQRSTGSAPTPTDTEASAVQHAAARGVAGTGSQLPHAEAIQRLFGRHDISSVEAHVGGEAATASRAIGAEANWSGASRAFIRLLTSNFLASACLVAARSQPSAFLSILSSWGTVRS